MYLIQPMPHIYIYILDRKSYCVCIYSNKVTFYVSEIEESVLVVTIYLCMDGCMCEPEREQIWFSVY